MKTLLALAFLLTLPCYAQRTAPASPEELEAIEHRGRLLFEYDRAAWHATDAVLALNPPRDHLGLYVAQKVGDRWQVVFGQLSTTRDTFRVRYLARQDSSPVSFSVEAFDPARPDTGFAVRAARAIRLAGADFTGTWPKYNVAVLPTDSAHMYVYFVPAPLEDDAFPLGSDARCRVSYDGEHVLDRRQMHQGTLVFPPDSLRGKPIQFSFHVAILDEAPEDSDVFHVLARRPSVDEYVFTKRWVYGIKAWGRLLYFSTTERFFEKK